jgi:hypothetical protein
MSIRNLTGGKKRLARRADNLAAICEPQPLATLWASTACTGIALLNYFYVRKEKEVNVQNNNSILSDLRYILRKAGRTL